MAKRYFTEEGETVYAIVNAQDRVSDDDVMIRLPLDAGQFSTYKDLRQNGKSDSVIFRRLFPVKGDGKAGGSNKIVVDVNYLNKEQVLTLITDELGLELKTLNRMTVNDLRELLVVLMRRKG